MISNHKYSAQIALHEKCGLILEQMNKYISQLNEAEDKLSMFDKAKPLEPIRYMYSRPELGRRVDRLKHFVSRSFKFYQKHVDQINALIADLNKPTDFQRRIELLGKVVDQSKDIVGQMLWPGSPPGSYTFDLGRMSDFSALTQKAWRKVPPGDKSNFFDLMLNPSGLSRGRGMNLTAPNAMDYGNAELTSHLVEPVNVPYDTSTD